MTVRRFIIMQLVWASAVILARAIGPLQDGVGAAYLLRLTELAGFVALPVLLNAFIWRKGDQWLLQNFKREDASTRLSRRKPARDTTASSAPASDDEQARAPEQRLKQ